MQTAASAEESTVVGLHQAADPQWTWFERQPDKVQDEARRRLRAIDAVEALEEGGHTRSAAVATVAAQQAVCSATLWNWVGLIAGCARHNRLPALAPRRVGGGKEGEIASDVWTFFKSDYLRPERPTWAGCYERTKTFAASRGLEVPSLKTLQRKLEREVDGRVIVAKREGAEALRRLLPPQERSVAALQAMELVNIDGHKWDVFVRFPAANGEPERIARPMMVAIQDVMSRKFLSWRIGPTESAVLTRLAFADLFKTWGIPEGCLLDNGRAFASKWITGGSKTRFRFTIRPEDPEGLLTSLGVKIHWATPYRGQSKPIERGFRDLCEHGAKSLAFAGAYTGNRPDAKPENYGDKAVDLAVFEAVVAKIMAAHNAKAGRRTEMAKGGSFDQAFAASYSQHPIRRATPEQLRMALLAAEKVTADRATGAVNFYGNRYFTEELLAVAGQRVVVRFDPQNLHSEVHVYTMDNRYVATAPIWGKVGFLDVDAAKARARQEADHRKTTRRLAELEDILSAEQLQAMLPDDAPEEEAPSPNVIRPVRMRGNAAAAAAATPRRAPAIDRLNFEELAPAREVRAPLRVVE